MTTKPKLDIVRIVVAKNEWVIKKNQNRPDWLIRRPDVEVERVTLTEGDYSLKGHEHQLMIERKTVGDACKSWAQDRERFEREWQRAVAKGYLEKHLIIEGRLVAVADWDYRSDFKPASFLASLYSWAIKYAYHVSWLGSRDGFLEAQKTVYWICRQFKRRAERGG
jgi:ERCC4-type nuclease